MSEISVEELREYHQLNTNDLSFFPQLAKAVTSGKITYADARYILGLEPIEEEK